MDNTIENYYWDLGVQYEMFNFVRDREIMIKGLDKYATRLIKITNLQSLQFWFKIMNRNYGKYNIYYSLGSYDWIPSLTANLKERKEDENYIEFNRNYAKYMKKYDLFVDIDAPTHDDMKAAHLSAKSVFDYFNKMNVPFELRFSGMGFHFIIPYDYTQVKFSFEHNNDNNIYKYFNRITKELNNRFSEMIDTGLHDGRRVLKLPYSLAVYNDCCYVCYPFLSGDEFLNFKLQDVTPENILLNINYDNFKKTRSQRETKIFNSSGNLKNLLVDMNL